MRHPRGRRLRVRSSAARLTALLAVLWAGAASAGGFHISILGLRRTAMMTNLGNPDDVSALFHNPAGLADQAGTRFHASSGMTFLGTHLNLQELDPQRFPEVNPEGCGQGQAAACPWPVDDEGYYEANIGPERYLGVIPYLGLSQDLAWVSPSLRDVVVSVASYAPGAYGAYLPEDAPTAYFVTEGLFVTVATTLGLGWRVAPWLSLGGNLSVNYLHLGFAQKFSTTDLLTPADEEPGFVGRMGQNGFGDLKLDYSGEDMGFGWSVGALVGPFANVRLGLGYAGSTSAAFDGPVQLSALGNQRTGAPPRDEEELAELLGQLGYKLPERLEVEMPIPPSVQAGLSWQAAPWLELGLDFRLWLYTLFERQTIRPIYDPDAPGQEPMSEDALSHDKDYSNSWEIALGLRLCPLPQRDLLEIMLGVGWDQSPVPDKSFSIDNPSMNQLLFTGGLRSQLTEHLRAGAGYMMIRYQRRDVTTSQSSPPTNVRIWGVSHIPTVEMEWLF